MILFAICKTDGGSRACGDRLRAPVGDAAAPLVPCGLAAGGLRAVLAASDGLTERPPSSCPRLARDGRGSRGDIAGRGGGSRAGMLTPSTPWRVSTVQVLDDSSGRRNFILRSVKL
jgi:hypothetical protein